MCGLAAAPLGLCGPAAAPLGLCEPAAAPLGLCEPAAVPLGLCGKSLMKSVTLDEKCPPSPGLDLATTCAFFSASSSHINELPHNGVKILENVLVRDAGSLQIAQYELVHSHQGPVRRHGRARGANSCLALSSRTQAKRDAESKRTAKAAVLRQTVETPPRTDYQNSSRPLSGLVV